MKIVEIKGKTAIVEVENHKYHKHTVNLALLQSVKVGDNVLAHGDIAINKKEADI